MARVYRPKACARCGGTFKPTGPRALYCCKPAPNARGAARPIEGLLAQAILRSHRETPTAPRVAMQFREVAQANRDHDAHRLREALVDLAACALAWASRPVPVQPGGPVIPVRKA